MSRDSRAILDPVSRLMEVLFGLIMALTFTLSLSAATDGREEVRTLLIAALGCNLAWGIVDAVMYLLTTMLERGKGRTTLRLVRGSADAAEARAAIGDAMPPLVAGVLRPADYDFVRARLLELPEPPRPRITLRDLRGAIAVLLLVFLATMPVALPFAFIDETLTALRVSNGIALATLYLCGHSLARYAGFRPVLTGLLFSGGGAALVMLTMALGG